MGRKTRESRGQQGRVRSSSVQARKGSGRSDRGSWGPEEPRRLQVRAAGDAQHSVTGEAVTRQESGLQRHFLADSTVIKICKNYVHLYIKTNKPYT